MPDVLHSLLLLAGAFLLGSVPGRWLRGGRSQVVVPDGGAPDAMPEPRWRGPRIGAAAFDVAKGGFAAWLGLHLAPAAAAFAGPTAHAYAAAIAAGLGHSLPVWQRLRAGPALLPLAGAVLVLWPWVVPVLLAVWGGTLLATGFPVVASALAALALVAAAWWSGAPAPRFVFAGVAAAMVLAGDGAALRRLARGEAPRHAAARLLWRLRRGPR